MGTITGIELIMGLVGSVGLGSLGFLFTRWVKSSDETDSTMTKQISELTSIVSTHEMVIGLQDKTINKMQTTQGDLEKQVAVHENELKTIASNVNDLRGEVRSMNEKIDTIMQMLIKSNK